MTRRDLIRTAGLTIISTTGVTSSFLCPSVDAAEPDPFGFPDETSDSLLAAGSRSRVLVSQLTQGLNYLGQPADFVSRYDIAAFNTSLNSLFALAIPAEKARSQYRQDKKIKDNRDQHFDDQINASLALQSSQESEITTIETTVQSDKDAADELEGEIDKQRAVVLDVQNQFDDAVRSFTQNSGCSLGDLLHGVEAVVGVVAAAYTGGASLVATVGSSIGTVRSAISAASDAKTVSDLVKDVQKGYKSVVTVVDSVKSEWTALQNAWKTFSTTLNTPDGSSKLITDADGLDGQLTRFASAVDQSPVSEDLKERFKQEVSKFYNLAQTRNSKLLEIDSLYLRESSLRDQIDQRKSEQLKLQSLKAANADPDADQYLTLLDKMSGAFLEQMRVLVWQEAGALWLWSLTAPPSAARLDGVTFTDLAFAHGILQSEFTTRETLAPGNAESFSDHLVSFKIDKSDAGGLQNNGKIGLNVARADFPATWYAIYITNVSVRAQGLQSFSATLTHPGQGTFEGVGKSDPPLTFSMAPRTSTATDQSAADLGAQEGKYVGLSPFTSWLLAFTNPTPAGLAGLTQIDLIFKGKNRTRPA